MRILLIILLLLSNNVFAKEAKTDSFAINLPDNFHVETDKKSRLLAFGGKGPNDVPFLSIEFGKRVNPEQVIERVNSSIKQLEKSLREEKCSPDCRAYYVELSTPVNNITAYRYHYIVQSEKLNFIILYGDKESLESGRKFVKEIATQILNNGI